MRELLLEQFVNKERGEESSGDNRAEEKVTGSAAKVRGLLAAQGTSNHHKNDLLAVAALELLHVEWQRWVSVAAR